MRRPRSESQCKLHSIPMASSPRMLATIGCERRRNACSRAGQCVHRSTDESERFVSSGDKVSSVAMAPDSPLLSQKSLPFDADHNDPHLRIVREAGSACPSRSSIISALRAFFGGWAITACIQAVASRHSNSMLSGISDSLLNGDRITGKTIALYNRANLSPQRSSLSKSFLPPITIFSRTAADIGDTVSDGQIGNPFPHLIG